MGWIRDVLYRVLAKIIFYLLQDCCIRIHLIPSPIILNPPNPPIPNPPNIVPIFIRGEVLVLGGGGV